MLTLLPPPLLQLNYVLHVVDVELGAASPINAGPAGAAAASAYASGITGVVGRLACCTLALGLVLLSG